MNEAVAAWLDGQGAWPDGARLPAHTPTCFGCGPDAPAGLHLAAYRVGDEVVATYTFAEAHEGGPGLAHGGAVAALCDDLLGALVFVMEMPVVTRNLSIDYHRPVLLGEPHRLHAHVEAIEGRKVWLVGEGRGPDGTVRFTARGLFIRVGVEHFLAGLSPDERARAEAELRRRAARDDDVTAP